MRRLRTSRGKKAVDYAKQNAKLNGSPAHQQLIDAS
jgi:hypothetical protein